MEDFVWEVTGDAVRITGYRGRAEELTIPDMLGGLPVRVLGRNAFNGNRHLRSLRMGSHVVVIEPHAFFYCTGLRELSLNPGLREIGAYAFHKCPIARVLLPQSLRTLGEKSFHAMENYDDFRQEIQVEEGNPHLFTDGHALYCREGEEVCLFAVFSAEIKAFRSFCHDVRYTVHESCTCIGRRSFANCRNLKAVTLPEGLRVIEDEAFLECISISEIALPQSLRQIGSDAFLNTNIAAFAIPAAIEEIGEGAFAVREQWNRRRYAKNLSLNGENARYQVLDNKLLHTDAAGEKTLLADFSADDCIRIPAGVAVIGSRAYHHSNAVTIHIPSTVRHIRPGAFACCSGLKRLYMELLGERGCLYMPGAKGEYDGKPVHEQCLSCIGDTEDGWLFDFEKYDSLFPSVSDKGEKILMAANRLKWDVRLEEKYRQHYLQYLRRHAADAVKTVVELDELESLHSLAGLGIFNENNIDGLIALANRAGKSDVLSYLMQYKHSHVGMSGEDYEL